jgi:ComF family protein
MVPASPVNARRLNPVDGWLRRLSLRLLPPRCLLCRAPGAAGRELCADCARDLPWNRACCARCALPLPPAEVVADERICGHCQQHPPEFERLLAPFRYAYPLDGLVTRFKFRHDLAAGALLADLMAEARAGDGADQPDLVVPVPLHVLRLRERGYNQSLELAKRLAPALALHIDAGALVRRRATAAQTELDAAERRRNVRDAFVADPARVRDRRIALVDDVATTAATAEACARALRTAGACAVEVWVAARAPDSGSRTRAASEVHHHPDP